MIQDKMRTWIEFDGKEDVCAIAFETRRVSFRIADIPFTQMKGILEKYNIEYNDIAKMRSSERQTK